MGNLKILVAQLLNLSKGKSENLIALTIYAMFLAFTISVIAPQFQKAPRQMPEQLGSVKCP